jgi:nitrogen regulatory protein P-II 1
MGKISKIEIITRPNKFEELKESFNKIGVTGLTVTQVLGSGLQKGKTEMYRGAEYSIDVLPKVKIEVVVHDELIETVIATTSEVCKTGNIGDGKIFVYPIERVIRIRTGEEAIDAL